MFTHIKLSSIELRSIRYPEKVVMNYAYPVAAH